MAVRRYAHSTVIPVERVKHPDPTRPPRNSVLLQSNLQQHAREVAHLVGCWPRFAGEWTAACRRGANAKKTFEARVKSDDRCARHAEKFSHFHRASVGCGPPGPTKARSAADSYTAYDAGVANTSVSPDPAIDRRRSRSRPRISQFRDPVATGFPIMVPGQVITQKNSTSCSKLMSRKSRLRTKRRVEALFVFFFVVFCFPFFYFFFLFSCARRLCETR